jgi:hypothetical protein
MVLLKQLQFGTKLKLLILMQLHELKKLKLSELSNDGLLVVGEIKLN